jgi:hypothetical protein
MECVLFEEFPNISLKLLRERMSLLGDPAYLCFFSNTAVKAVRLLGRM